jgi:hypothetical protein
LRRITGLETARVGLNPGIFIGNIVQVPVGAQESIDTYIAVYNPISDNYELKIDLQLSRAGDYSWSSAVAFTMFPNRCVNYTIRTSAERVSDDQIIEFTVEP